MFDDMPNPYEDLYIWDSLEKKGFPLSPQIRCVHLDHPGRREIIAAGTVDEIEDLIDESGQLLNDCMLEVLKSFVSIMFKVYADQPDEKRHEILQYIRSLAGEQ
jgi:hypothetical protein